MGEGHCSLGVGDVSVRFLGINDIFVVATMYWITNYTSSTMHPVYMKSLSRFKITLVYPLAYFYFIEHSRNKFSCDTTVKNNLYNLKLKVLKPTQVLGYKTNRSNRCTYEPAIVVLCQTCNNSRKMVTLMYIKQNMGHAYHKKIQDMEELGIFKEPLKSIPKMTVTTPICIIDKSN